MSEKEIIFCKSGGCTAKLGAGVLEHILERLPKGQKDENLLVGYDSSDDAAVYKLNDHQAFVQTLDFFPPMVEDPYLFGQIAATNALSDIYAMGGDVKTALNIVCFPESMDLNILGKILQGGAEKVQEAGGSLAGGHSIADSDVKYGLSVTGVVDPEKIWKNNGAKSGDKLILTKRLGVGIICAANRVKQAPGAMECAEEFLLTAAGQKNRNHLEGYVQFEDISFGMEEVLYDPQTSGGLLFAVSKEQADNLCEKLQIAGLPAAIVGEVTEQKKSEIFVINHKKK